MWSWKKLVLTVFPFTFPVNSSANTTYPIIASRLSCPVPFLPSLLPRPLLEKCDKARAPNGSEENASGLEVSHVNINVNVKQ